MEDNNNTSSAKKEVNELNTNNSNRIITNIYDCLQRRFGPVRIVGSVDIDGYGTSHNITGAETDPFVLSEYVSYTTTNIYYTNNNNNNNNKTTTTITIIITKLLIIMTIIITTTIIIIIHY